MLATLSRRPSFGLALSPDGRTVLYAQRDLETNELMQVERLATAPSAP